MNIETQDFDDFDKVIAYESLYKSGMKCRLGVGWKDSTARYIENILEETLILQEQLESGRYHTEPPIRFKIYEPKEREIQSLRFRNKVFQRSLCDNALVPGLMATFIYDNGASLPGRGVDFAMRRLKAHLQKYYREYGLDGYVYQFDIRHYFDSINHEAAMRQVRKRFKDERIVKYTEEAIAIFGDVGLGLGSQVSQILALATLNELDHFIKEELHIKYYGRYMDDFYLIHHDKEYLKYCRERIEEKLTEIGLELNPKKTQLYPIRNGIKFLGFHFRMTETGKVYMKISRKSVTRQRRKLRKMKTLLEEGRVTFEDVQMQYQSWRAHALRGNSKQLVKKMDQYFNELFIEDWLRQPLEP
ncbi:reverse transcriptase/maturase family protein [Dorea acetigenes]|uniref:Reverse transcriptase/maturase family protein n=1 Tax=Dorea acetigenes TaxID=2981787 RepID=A0ABT2RJR9_9FIRM|nr:reverse transcriptase domain-containing protein [Dorea acetigenes]MCU6685653.1 reverse transcriptase/maturase family protein [Dorea acetigenes]SCI58530.1 Retron-type reverse transcriptase [uncultured Clostridium sp.]